MSYSAGQMFAELQASILFGPDRPKCFPSYEGLDPSLPEYAAINLARQEYRRLEELVRSLGQSRYLPAIPALAQLWRECALEPIKFAAGHALLRMETPEAWNALEAMVDSQDHSTAFLAVKAVFARDPTKAYDYFEPLFAERTGCPAPGEALLLLAPWSISSDGTPSWTENGQDWLKQDPRWLVLCARLRSDRELGFLARQVLRHAPSSDRMAALDQARREEAKDYRPSPSSVSRIGDLLTRYEKGDFANVWSEIRIYPSIGGDFRAEVQEVAEATMRRVAHNVDLLAERLNAHGWRALVPLGESLRTAPSSENEAIFEAVEKITECPVPPSLLAFWRVVGGVNFVWDYDCESPLPMFAENLSLDGMDPLCVAPPAELPYIFEVWEEQKNEPDPDLIEPFQIDLAPDDLHKANISGGAPYSVSLPFWGADPVLDGERHRLPFTDYLRMCFRWAGFPGLQYHSDHAAVLRFIEQFGKGLEPF